MAACWGSGFGNPPGTMLQVERDFQQQGLKYLHCVILIFSEYRREQRIVEDVVKLFTGNGALPLHRNHEAETKDGCYTFCGKNWCMNLGDVPAIPTTIERSYARRFRGIYMRSGITGNAEDMNIMERTFLADEDAEAFISSGDLVKSFYQDFFFKFKRQRSPQ